MMVGVVGGVSQTDLGRGGDGGSVVYAVFSTAWEVMLEGGRLVPAWHRVEAGKGVES